MGYGDDEDERGVWEWLRMMAAVEELFQPGIKGSGRLG